ncbi:MAG: peptidoglycan DD-metalloendopeptidase family protein [Bacteroidia bacterium]|nr:peptidoglycan DD-metalloendopeptidase family protein [Bacteroidia bacterium]
MRLTRSRIYKVLFIIGLFLIGTGRMDAHTLNGVFNLDVPEGGNPSNSNFDIGTNFDSTFNTAWEIYLNTWNTEILNPYSYDFTSFNQPVSLCLTHGDSLGFVMPVVNAITSNFGPRHGRAHQGVDIDLETGDTVVSAFDGVVRMSRYYYGYGNMVVIRHHNGLETLYGHLSKVLLEPGAVVKAGQSVGLGGNTGHSFGSHLHFEIRFMGQPIDPAKFIAFETFSLLNNEVLIDSATFENYKLVKRQKPGDNAHTEEHYKSVKKTSKYHVVKQGDTLSAIARKHKTTVAKLCKLNNIKPTTILRLGRKLKVK